MSQVPFGMYGQTSDETKRVRAFIGDVAKLAAAGDCLLDECRRLLNEADDQFPQTTDVFVISASKLLSQIIEDGTIDVEEKALLSGLTDLVTHPVSDVPVDGFEGKKVVLSGDFELEGGKAAACEMIEAAGGRVVGSVSGRTDFVIVGSRGSDAWAFEGFGKKIEKALGLQITGGKVRVISESAFVASVRESSPDALEAHRLRVSRFTVQWEGAKVVGDSFDGLTEGQQKAFDLIGSGQNVYLSGLGGTGKSFVLKKIIDRARSEEKNVIVCAPTGIAALNVGGSTIHRVLGIRPGRTLQAKADPFIKDDSPLLACDLMIVDEISMCRVDLFDYLTAALQKAAKLRKKSGRPPCQMMVVGDFCQLPPVIQREEKPVLDKKYGFDIGGGYAFMGSGWDYWSFVHVELTEAIRQRDSSFVAALNACRVGDLRGVRWIVDHASKTPIEEAIVLCGKNRVADDINRKCLSSLKTEEVVFDACLAGELETQDMPTSKRLSLKAGARVMALVNESEHTFMNGSLGTVRGFSKGAVLVDFDNLGVSKVGWHSWDITKPTVVDGKTRLVSIGSFEQIPLKLAWAITIHKSQGQTFEAANIYPESWDCGQLYTALSRLTRVENMHLAYGVNDDFLKASDDVIAFTEGRYVRKCDASSVE